MRVLLFGTGSDLSLSCLEALSGAGHETLFVTRQISLKSKLRRLLLRRWPAPERFARGAGIPIHRYVNAAHSRRTIAALRPDIICIASFQLLIPQSIAALAPFGALNLHTSLLPRHRGPQTVFQIYHDGDEETGITVHRATRDFDAGPIIVQERIPVPRGYPARMLVRDFMTRAGPALLEAIARVQAGAPEQPQDEALATRSRRADPEFSIPFDRWDVEQSWHFLAGYSGAWTQKLSDGEGRPVAYRSVGGYRRMSGTLPPGTVAADGDGWLLHCKGGVIRLDC